MSLELQTRNCPSFVWKRAFLLVLSQKVKAKSSLQSWNPDSPQTRSEKFTSQDAGLRAPVGQACGPSFSPEPGFQAPKEFLSKAGAAEKEEGERGRSAGVSHRQRVPPCGVHCPLPCTAGLRALPPTPPVSARPRRRSLQTKNTSVPGAGESPDFSLCPENAVKTTDPRARAFLYIHLCTGRPLTNSAPKCYTYGHVCLLLLITE